MRRNEAALLKNLVASMIGLLEERESSSPQDELEQITGMKTGKSEPPDNVTLQRLRPISLSWTTSPEERRVRTRPGRSYRALSRSLPRWKGKVKGVVKIGVGMLETNCLIAG
jgi:Domain of unknown function (DUF2017)